MNLPSDETFEENTSFTEDCDVNSVTAIASGEILNISSAAILSAEQCQQILDTCIEELWMPCRVVGDNNLHKGHRQKLKGNTDGFPFSEIKDITKNAMEATIATPVANPSILSIKLTALIIPTTHKDVNNPLSHGFSSITTPVPFINNRREVISPTRDCDMNLTLGDNSYISSSKPTPAIITEGKINPK